ncbi:hypothetical protein B0H19DRAFT_1071123 [Mycena capillaripes]|nr:hypothetical protein B0H19DRAFT_1071123 [Mycena capillaripes]
MVHDKGEYHFMAQVHHVSGERGGQHPLRIRVAVKTSTQHVDLYGPSVLELLSQHAHRQHINLWADHDWSQYLANARGNLPLLQTLRLSAHWDGAEVFAGAPGLTMVSLCVPNYDTPTNGLTLALSLGSGSSYRLDIDLTRLSVDATWPRVSADLESLSLDLGFKTPHQWCGQSVASRPFLGLCPSLFPSRQSHVLPYLRHHHRRGTIDVPCRTTAAQKLTISERKTRT